MAEKLVLLDGNSIMNRAFYGLPLLTNSSGLHTNAMYGFVNILLRILSEENPDYLCVAFDVKAPTFRHKIYEAYKGTRKGMPDELREQVEPLKELLKAMKIAIVEKAGYEADDILGTIAKKSEKEGLTVSLVSGDRDLLQIATDHIMVRIPKTKGGKTEIEDYHTKDVVAKYSLEPYQIIELKALMGDSSDNIPGVPKVGEKTATSLLLEYKDVDNLYSHIEEIAKPGLKNTLIENKELAYLSRKLATIDIDAKIDYSLSDFKIEKMFNPDSYALFKKYEFKNLLNRFDEDVNQVTFSLEGAVKLVTDFIEAEAIFDSIAEYDTCAFSLVTSGDGNGLNGEIKGISLALSEEKIYFILAGGMLQPSYITKRFADIIMNTSVRFVSYDIKKFLKYASDVNSTKLLSERIFDVNIAAYLINPLKNDYTVLDIASEYNGIVLSSWSEIFKKKSIDDIFDEDHEEEIKKLTEYFSNLTYVCFSSIDKLISKLEEYNMRKLYQEIEMPLVGVLADMECEGIKILPDELKEYGDKLKSSIKDIEKEIIAEAGEEFNINSPVQLGEILFVKMGLPGGKKTKKGYSTAADVLEKLAPDYPFVKKILDYRALSKLVSTYVDGLKEYIASDGRIRSTFNQTITATGRISSTEPNLQNIPIRMEQGRLIRKVFVPKDGCVFLDADYSQIELRIMAHLSQDEGLIEAFNRGDDIHAITASKVFNVPLEDVTSLMRRNAKAVNFGIIYGISAFGLSEDLSISRKEAKEFIEQYFVTFPKVKVFLDKLVEDAKQDGYVTTVFGRRRPVPELASSNFMTRSFGERVAMNAPIQGTAADIMKIAMVRVHDRLLEEGCASKVILQVHDELLIETLESEVSKVEAILKEEMEEAVNMKVKLTTECMRGSNWYEAK